jgi:AcrR family transcriptional regulator
MYKTVVQDFGYPREVGNRDALIAAARDCLDAKGYARTTARDIASSAGVSLAAIGYHFHATDALLTEAILDGIGQWGAELGRELAEVNRTTASPFERFEQMWTQVIASFHQYRGVLASSYELMARGNNAAEVRQALAAAVSDARLALANMFLNIDAERKPDVARQVGSLLYAILSGVLTQWLIDPDAAPSGHDLAVALREITSNMRF